MCWNKLLLSKTTTYYQNYISIIISVYYLRPGIEYCLSTGNIFSYRLNTCSWALGLYLSDAIIWVYYTYIVIPPYCISLRSWLSSLGPTLCMMLQ